MSKVRKYKKIGLFGLIMIILSTEFGFSNTTTAFYQMGYASIIWYVISAVTFLFPLVFICAEMGGSMNNESGGFYNWLSETIGEKWAFIGTFMWLLNFIINILGNISGLGINLSSAVHGHDTSGSWQVGPLNSMEIEAILGIILIIIVTYAACRGLNNVSITGIVGGITSMTFIGIFILNAIINMVANHGHLFTPVHGISSFIKSPNPQFQSPIAISSFIVYALFAYAGLESTSSMIDKLKNPRRTFPHAMLWVGVIETFLYVIGIFLCGYVINWTHTFSSPKVNLGNMGLAFNSDSGIYFAKSVGLSKATGLAIGSFMNRLGAIVGLITLLGLLLVLIYAPIKGLITGSSKDLWPKSIARFNKHDMPSGAMWAQCIFIVIIMALISLTGKNYQNFFTIMTDMNNISSVFPYFFLVVGFIHFKRNHNISHPIVMLHHKVTTWIAVIMLIASMIFAIISNLLSPLLEHQYMTTFWSFIGPIVFLFLSIIMYYFGIRRRAKRMIKDNVANE